MKGTVKWFNAKKVLVSFQTRQVRMYSYIIQHFRWMVSKFLTKVKKWNLTL